MLIDTSYILKCILVKINKTGKDSSNNPKTILELSLKIFLSSSSFPTVAFGEFKQ